MKNSSNHFVVTLSVAGTTASKTWDAENELTIGHPMRWVLARTSCGVKIRNIADGSESEVTNDAIAEDSSFELPDTDPKARSAFKLQLKLVKLLPAAFTTHEPSDKGASGELRVYSLKGIWTQSADTVAENFTGYDSGKKAFTLRKTGAQTYLLRAHADGLSLESPRKGAEPLEFSKGEEKSFSAEALSGKTISIGESSWKLDTQTPVQAPNLTEAQDNEEAQFRRTLKGSMILMLALALFSLVMPKPEVIEPQKTRFVFTKRTAKGMMTAAAQGDRNARDTSQGNTKVKNPRGSDKPALGKATKPSKASPKAAVKSVAKKKSQSKQIAKIERKKPVSKPVTRESSKPTQKALAKAAKGKPQPVSPRTARTADLSKTAIGKLLQAQSFRNATEGLSRGGVSGIKGSRGEGRSELGALSGGRSALDDTSGIASGNGVGARAVQVSGLGGGNGATGGKGVGYGRGSHAAVNGQGKSFVSLDASASDVAEGLTKDQVGRVIHRHMSEIRYCYEAAMIRTPDVEGKLAVNFVINGSGRVKRADVAQSSLGDNKLDNCVMQRLARWQFPQPRGGVDVAVNYPFVFKTLGR